MDEKPRDNEIEALRAEVKELRKYKAVFEQQKSGLGVVSAASALLWLGPGLSIALKNFLTSVWSRPPEPPLTETAELVTAIIRRVIRVGIFMVLLALVPSALLFWQNLIMKQQYSALLEQLDAQRDSDINQQVTQYFPLLLSEDRASFWAAASFFTSSPELSREAIQRLARLLFDGEGRGACAALEALSRIAPQHSTLPDGHITRSVTQNVKEAVGIPKLPLGGIRIRDLDCPGVRLSHADLSELTFEEARLQQAVFAFVSLAGSDFQGADLRGAEFLLALWASEDVGRGSNLSDSDLRSAKFDLGAAIYGDQVSLPVLNGARLDGAMFNLFDLRDLQGVPKRYFKGAACLSPRQARSCYDFHRQTLFGQNPSRSPPNSCPADLSGPIINVGVSSVIPCINWLNRAG